MFGIFKRIQRKIDESQFRDGFEWAMSSYHVDHIPLNKLQQALDDGYAFDPGPFDRGARRALKTLRTWERLRQEACEDALITLTMFEGDLRGED